MQHIRAVAVDDAFGLARCARGVAHAAGVVLIDLDPGEIAVRLSEPILISDRLLEVGLRHMSAVREDHVAFDRGQLRGKLLDERHEGEVEEQEPVLCVIDDEGDLILEETWVYGVINRAGAHDPVPAFDVTGGVPGERGDAVPRPDAVGDEALRGLYRALAQLRVVRFDQRPLDGARHDAASWMLLSRVIDDLIRKKRPFLHQSKHRFLHPRLARRSRALIVCERY